MEIAGIILSIIGGVFFLVGVILSAAISEGEAIEILRLVFMLIGAFLLAMGIIFVIVATQKNKKKQSLIENGKYIMAIIKNIRLNVSVRINGRHPKYAECYYEDPMTGNVHVFRSENMENIPEELIGSEVKVYVEGDNFKNYYVDIKQKDRGYIYH